MPPRNRSKRPSPQTITGSRPAAKTAFRSPALAVLGAVLTTLAFPQPGLFPLAWVGLVPLLKALDTQPAGRAFLLGWLFGAAHALGISYWLFNALYYNANAGLAVSLVFMLLVVGGGVGLYFAFFALGANRVLRSSNTPLQQAAGLAALWVAVEYCRAHLFTGIPWELLGYSQYRWTSLIQVADFTGVYGLSFVIVFANACLFSALKKPLNLHALLKRLVPAAGLVAMLIVYGAVQAARYSAGTPAPVTVAVIQGSIPQQEKWREENRSAIIADYAQLAEAALRQQARLVILPETALNLYLETSFPDSLRLLLKSYNAAMVLGGPRYEQIAGSDRFYNAAFLADRRGIRRAHDKLHLLPFGEYFPLGGIDMLRLRYAAPRQYTPGDRYDLLPTPAGGVGALLCFEIIYPRLSRGFVKAGADLLVNLSNDAWFGRTSAHYQHFSMAVLRAVEFRRPVLRAANTGISGFVSPAGEIIKSLAPFTEGFLIHAPRLYRHETFYCRFGDIFAGLCFLGALLALLWKKRAAAGKVRRSPVRKQ